MLTIAYYFLQVVLCSGMLMGYYWLVLRNKRFHQYNRFYLLAAALLSWIVPLIKITWSQPVVASEQPQVMQFLSVVADNNSQIEETISAQPVSGWNWDLPLTAIYFAVAVTLFFGLVRALTRLYRLLRDHSCKNVGDVYLILTQAKGTPFSFFRYIFWNEEIDIRSEAGKQILQHELTHVQQKHSFDKLFIQVMLIGGWFNPFFWLLRKEMDMIHEFIADKKAVNNGDAASLAQMLLTAAYPQQNFALTHPFFFSPIKRRLQMLTNNKNPRYSYIRRLVVLPLLAIVTVLFAFRSKDRRDNGEISVATVMEKVAADQKQFFDSFLQGVNNLFDDNTTEHIRFRSVFYNGRPVTVPTSFRLKDLDNMMVTHLDKDHLNLIPVPHLSANEADPVFVINGVRQNGKAALEQLNPDEIDMIRIWKGADAFARYGDSGKDGVIEITTKAFAAGKHTDGFNGVVYEGIAKDPLDNVARNRTLYIKVTIRQGEADKTLVWEETHLVQSNENGGFSFVLGKDVKSSTRPENEIEKLNWTQGPYFVNLAIAVSPSIVATWWVPQDNYKDAGTTRMMSIPFPAATVRSAFESYQNIRGRSVTVAANATASVSIEFNPAKKGDQVYVTPKEDPLGKWAIYNGTVDEDGTIKLRVANYTDKAITISGDSYTVGLGKFNGQPSAGWVPRYADVLIIVDGEVYKEDVNTINPDNISSVTVLKDAASIAKYGPEAKNGVILITTKSQNGNRFLITDSLGNVNWQKTPANPSSTKYTDTLPKFKGTLRATSLPYITAVGTRLSPQAGRELASPRMVVEGHAMDNSAATLAIKKRNPDVKLIVWKDRNHLLIQLNDGTEETYNISKPASKKRAEKKYGPLPEVPEKVANAKPGPGEIVIPGTIIGGTFSGTVTASSIKRDEVIVTGYPRRSMEPASFPGGLSAWAKYLDRTLNEDIPHKKGAPAGKYTVILSFDVSREGVVSNVRAENDPGYGTKEEAIRVIATGPNWKPAVKDGKAVAYTHQLSITFYVKEPQFTSKPLSFNLNLSSPAGKDVTIGPNTTAIASVTIPGAKKGDPIIATPKDDYHEWGIYSAWVPEENKVNIRFANYTDKEVRIPADQYKIAVVKQ